MSSGQPETNRCLARVSGKQPVMRPLVGPSIRGWLPKLLFIRAAATATSMALSATPRRNIQPASQPVGKESIQAPNERSLSDPLTLSRLQPISRSGIKKSSQTTTIRRCSLFLHNFSTMTDFRSEATPTTTATTSTKLDRQPTATGTSTTPVLRKTAKKICQNCRYSIFTSSLRVRVSSSFPSGYGFLRNTHPMS